LSWLLLVGQWVSVLGILLRLWGGLLFRSCMMPTRLSLGLWVGWYRWCAGVAIHPVCGMGWVASFLSFCVVRRWFVCKSLGLVYHCGRVEGPAL